MRADRRRRLRIHDARIAFVKVGLVGPVAPKFSSRQKTGQPLVFIGGRELLNILCEARFESLIGVIFVSGSERTLPVTCPRAAKATPCQWSDVSRTHRSGRRHDSDRSHS